MPGKLPSVSPAEWEVLKAIWNGHPVTANRIVELVGPAQGWNEKTVKTLINRLVKKAVLSFTSEGRTYLYSPVYSQAQYQEAESRTFIDRVLDGSGLPLVSYLVQNDKLNQAEIDALKALLEDKGKGAKK